MSALKARQIVQEDRCPICNNEGEDSLHALALCGRASAVWNRMGLTRTPLDFHSGNGLMDWMRTVVEKHEMESSERGITTMWMIWNSRNTKVFQNSDCKGEELPAKVDRYLQQCQDLLRRDKEHTTGNRPKWQPPPIGFVKLNCDGSVKPDGRCGVGAIVRDEDRAVLGVMASPLAQCWTVKEAEAAAIREGLLFARDSGFRMLLVESDAAEVIGEIQRHQPSCSPHGHIIEEIRHLARGFHFCSFTYIPRNCNTVADRLARGVFTSILILDGGDTRLYYGCHCS